ncbi:MAG: hypothetical protein M3134_09130 [Actinomycetota bacterium]|nr:hypothetical protein [Actinomycetota bacterium]
MKKAIVSAITLGLVAGAMIVPAEAAKKKKKKPARIEQVVEVPYTGGEIGVNTPVASGGGCLNGAPVFACKEIIPPSADFSYIKIEIKDATGLTVGGFLAQQDADGDGLQDGYGEFCGAHSESIPMDVPGTVVGISLYPGACDNGGTPAPSTPTTGTIVATFSNMP